MAQRVPAQRLLRQLSSLSTAQHALRTVETPAVVLERRVLERNIARMAALAAQHSVVLRPHIKTHKSLRVAALQRAAGAVGVTCAKPTEAELFLEHGFDVLLAYPVLCGRKLGRVLAAADRGGKAAGKAAAAGHAGAGGGAPGGLCVMVDSEQGVTACAEAAAAAAASGNMRLLEVMVKVDSGLHRCGVPPAGPELPALVEAVRRQPLLKLRGLMTHAGHVYGAADSEECTAIADAETRLMRDAALHAGTEAGTAAAASHSAGDDNFGVSVETTPCPLISVPRIPCPCCFFIAFFNICCLAPLIVAASVFEPGILLRTLAPLFVAASVFEPGILLRTTLTFAAALVMVGCFTLVLSS